MVNTINAATVKPAQLFDAGANPKTELVGGAALQNLKIAFTNLLMTKLQEILTDLSFSKGNSLKNDPGVWNTQSNNSNDPAHWGTSGQDPDAGKLQEVQNAIDEANDWFSTIVSTLPSSDPVKTQSEITKLLGEMQNLSGEANMLVGIIGNLLAGKI